MSWALWVLPIGSGCDELNWQVSVLFMLEGDGSGTTSRPISSVDFLLVGLREHAQPPCHNTNIHTPREEEANLSHA